MANKYKSEQFLEKMTLEAKSRVSQSRFQHILNVSECAYSLGKIYDCSPKLLRLSGILHDIDKGLSNEDVVKKALHYKLDHVIDKQVIEQMPHLLHGPTAACELHDRFPDIPKKVLRAIFVHTTADVKMSHFDMILYVADAIEPGRDYPEHDRLVNMVGKVSIEQLYFEIYRYWVVGLMNNKRKLYPVTSQIFNSIIDLL